MATAALRLTGNIAFNRGNGTVVQMEQVGFPAHVITSGRLDSARLPSDPQILGNLTPVANVTYDLGSAEYRWKDLWLSGAATGNGAALTALNASELTTGIVPAARFGANVAVGEFAGLTGQGNAAVAIGAGAGNSNQGVNAVAIGTNAGANVHAAASIAIGLSAGSNTQGGASVGIGSSAAAERQGARAVAIGFNAGLSSQGNDAIAIGRNAGNTAQQAFGVAVGPECGVSNQGTLSVAVGQNAGYSGQGSCAVAIGRFAGQFDQGDFSIAMGYQAGSNTQGQNAVAIGREAGETSQGVTAVAVGYLAGETSQGSSSVAVGVQAGQSSQSQYGTAVGWGAGFTGQGEFATAVGALAGCNLQANVATALGFAAGRSNQGQWATAVGYNAGSSNQGSCAVAVGAWAGRTSQLTDAVAVGYLAGCNAQGQGAVAIGLNAGCNAQGSFATAVGRLAGNTGQGDYATGLGAGAGGTNQGSCAVAIGVNTGNSGQGSNAVAIGYDAGLTGQGHTAIAMGFRAGYSNQHSNSIVINASGAVVNTGFTNQCLITPMRLAIGASATLVRVGNEIGTTSSSKRFKEHIVDLQADTGVIYDVRPVEFQYKDRAPTDATIRYAGLIAEDLEVLDPHLVTRDFEGLVDNIEWNAFATYLATELRNLRDGATYAEYYEAADANAVPVVGETVVLGVEGKVRVATSEDPASDILGVVRPKRSTQVTVPNAAENEWAGKYLRDDFGAFVMEPHDLVEWTETIVVQEATPAVYKTIRHEYEADAIPEGVIVPTDGSATTETLERTESVTIEFLVWTDATTGMPMEFPVDPSSPISDMNLTIPENAISEFRTVEDSVPYDVISWTEVTDIEEMPAQPAVTQIVPYAFASHALPPGITVPEDAVITPNAGVHKKLNPAYDPEQAYVPRSKRPEWIQIALMGRAPVLASAPKGSAWRKVRDVSLDGTVEEWVVAPCPRGWTDDIPARLAALEQASSS